MEDSYEEAVRGFEVSESVGRRVRGLVRAVWSLQLTHKPVGAVVEAVPRRDHGSLKAIGRFVKTRPRTIKLT
jgi:hypothetical protein